MNIGDSGGRGQDFDINLAPIIDCFTVLITFMLASASFLAIGIFDSSVAAPGAPTADAKQPPSVMLEVELNTQHEIQFKVSGKAKVDKKIPASGDKYNSDALVTEIENIKRQFPDVKTLTLSATDDVEYQHIIRMMDVLKTHIPTTLLGGI